MKVFARYKCLCMNVSVGSIAEAAAFIVFNVLAKIFHHSLNIAIHRVFRSLNVNMTIFGPCFVRVSVLCVYLYCFVSQKRFYTFIYKSYMFIQFSLSNTGKNALEKNFATSKGRSRYISIVVATAACKYFRVHQTISQMETGNAKSKIRASSHSRDCGHVIPITTILLAPMSSSILL